MTNFIKSELLLKHPIEKVWKAITYPNEVAAWFGSSAQFELKEGAEGFFEWQEECEGRFAMKIKEIKEPTYFAWYWMYQPDVAFDLDIATLVEWTLTETPRRHTKLVLLESGFREEEHRQMNVKGWIQELGDLEQYLG